MKVLFLQKLEKSRSATKRRTKAKFKSHLFEVAFFIAFDPKAGIYSVMTTQRRHLSDYEIQSLPSSFTQSFDIRAVELIDRPHNPFAQNKILCRGPRLYWQNHPKDFTRTHLTIQSLLVHELCHVWQYETGRLSAFRYLIDPRNWVYSYIVKADAKFDDYHTEKQADLLQDWYLVNSGAKPLRYNSKGKIPTKAWLNSVVPFHWTPR